MDDAETLEALNRLGQEIASLPKGLAKMALAAGIALISQAQRRAALDDDDQTLANGSDSDTDA